MSDLEAWWLFFEKIVIPGIVITIVVILFISLLPGVDRKLNAYRGRWRSNREIAGATMCSRLRHASGLPIAPNAAVDVYYCPDKFVFKKDEQEFIVSMNKVTCVDVVQADANQLLMMSGAATGYFISGGGSGRSLNSTAMVGLIGAATSAYLIIIYKRDDETRFVAFQTSTISRFARKAKKAFASTHVNNHTLIEL